MVLIYVIESGGMEVVVTCMQGELESSMHMDVTVRPDGTEAVTLSRYGTPALRFSRPQSL